MSISKRAVWIMGVPIATWLVSVGVAELAFRAVGKRTSDDQYGLYQSFGEGGWSAEDVAEFLDFIKPCEQIDEEKWA